MNDIRKVTMIKIDPEKVIKIGTEEYLILDDGVTSTKTKVERSDFDAARRIIVDILTEFPGSKRSFIEESLKLSYNINLSYRSFSNLMQGMKESGLIRVEGTPANALWYVV